MLDAYPEAASSANDLVQYRQIHGQTTIRKARACLVWTLGEGSAAVLAPFAHASSIAAGVRKVAKDLVGRGEHAWKPMMLSRSFAMLLAPLGVVPVTSPACASACVAARTISTKQAVPQPWQAALDDLVRSTAEPGHPWSCTGGTIELELDAQGGLLGVARAGETMVRRPVSSPEEVTPLGEALLAMPLALPLQPTAQEASGPRAEPVSPPVISPPPEVVREDAHAAASELARHVLVSAGLDSRYVGGSHVAWIGPVLGAALTLGRWLPSISLRQQSSVATHRPPLDELSVALGLQSRFELSSLELRAGVSVRGAVVQRDLSGRHGDQSRVEARLGALVGLAVPVHRRWSIVLSGDAEAVGASHETATPNEPLVRERATSFPKYTLGGSAVLEVRL